MKKIRTRLLIGLIFFISTITLLNIIVIYWIPIIIPFSSFTVIKLVALGLIEKAYWLIIIAFFICILMYIVIRAISKKQTFHLLIFSIYLLCDIVVLCPLLWESILTKHGFGWMYLIGLLLDFVVFILISIEIKTIRKDKTRTETQRDG